MKKLLITAMTVILTALQTVAQEEPKTGWVFTPFPDVSYNSDIGLNLGAFCDFFYYGDGTDYPNFQHHIAVSGAWATKGSWYLHGLFDSKTLIRGARVTGSLTYRDASMNNFYGFNGLHSPYFSEMDLNQDTREAYYTDHRQVLRAVATVQKPIRGKLNWMAGALLRSVRISDFDLKNYDNQITLYRDYRAVNLIHPDEALGGTSLEGRVGLTYDSRDVEWVPNKGMYWEAYVNGVADLLAYVMLYEPTILGTWPTDALYFSNSSKYALYVANYGGAAFQKHTHFPSLVGAAWQMTAGIGSEEYFWETAAGAIGSATLGFLVAGGTGHQSAGLDHACGLGARFAAEVGRAVGKARLTRVQANDLVNKILPKYQPLIDNRTLHTKGGDFRTVYDLEKVQPKPEYLAIYNKVKAELREMGLPIK